MTVGLEYPLLAVVGGALASLALIVYYQSRRELLRLVSYMGGRVSRLLALLASMRLAGLAMLALASGGLYTTTIDYVSVDNISADVLAKVKALHVVMIDDSKSMSYRDGGRERLDLARDVVRAYIESLGPQDRVAIYRFYSRIGELCQGTPMQCLDALDGLKGDERYSALGTALGEIATIARASGIPVVGVVVSDGGYNYGPDPLSVAAGMGDLKGIALVRVGSDPRGGVMEEVADRMGWLYYHVTGNVPEGIVEDLAGQVYSEAKVKAAATGEGLIPVERRSYTISLILALLGVLLLAASEVAGP
ncbi:MAG: VWA domain-containing protein [Desulfurococcales archaeon]|nr:VWA domain-containing protein [Desulfurococcales archaeon]